jgi:hypothetical protein
LLCMKVALRTQDLNGGSSKTYSAGILEFDDANKKSVSFSPYKQYKIFFYITSRFFQFSCIYIYARLLSIVHIDNFYGYILSQFKLMKQIKLRQYNNTEKGEKDA